MQCRAIWSQQLQWTKTVHVYLYVVLQNHKLNFAFIASTSPLSSARRMSSSETVSFFAREWYYQLSLFTCSNEIFFNNPMGFSDQKNCKMIIFTDIIVPSIDILPGRARRPRTCHWGHLEKQLQAVWPITGVHFHLSRPGNQRCQDYIQFIFYLYFYKVI